MTYSLPRCSPEAYGVAASCVAHACVAGVLGWGIAIDLWPLERARLNSRSGITQLAVAWSPAQLEMAPAPTLKLHEPVLIETENAWIAERQFTRRSAQQLPPLPVVSELSPDSATSEQPPPIDQRNMPLAAARTTPAAVTERVLPHGPRQFATHGQQAQSPDLAGTEHYEGARFINNAPPPPLGQGIRGSVLLEVHINSAGRVTDVQVLRTSGLGILDAAAVNAVRQWRAMPAKRAGEPVATVELQEVIYK